MPNPREPLFSLATNRLLERLPEALGRIRPLAARQARDLPEDVALLSRMLTADRELLSVPYWRTPGLVSAYLHYFLPWNLVRLLGVLGTMPLPPIGPGRVALVDIGSGPLTVPLALWLAFPELRRADVTVIAVDKAVQPLKLGRSLLWEMAQMAGEPAWPVRLIGGSMLRPPGLEREVGGMPVWLVTFGNILNEVAGGIGQALSLLRRLSRECGKGRLPGGLFFEPGTRLGGRTIMGMRHQAIADGWQVSHPCPHGAACPLMGRTGNPWCHFVGNVVRVPAFLADISHRAGLGKASLSLSLLLLGSASTPRQEGFLRARVLSAPFAAASHPQVRYGCSAGGLLLLEGAGDAHCGETVQVRLPATPRRDGRSGAICLLRGQDAVSHRSTRKFSDGQAPAADSR